MGGDLQSKLSSLAFSAAWESGPLVYNCVRFHQDKCATRQCHLLVRSSIRDLCIVPKIPACRAYLCSLRLCNVAISWSSFWQVCCFPGYTQSFTTFWHNLQLPSGLCGIRSRVSANDCGYVRNTRSTPSSLISCGGASHKSFSMTHGFRCSRPKSWFKAGVALDVQVPFVSALHVPSGYARFDAPFE